MTEIQPCFRYL